VLAHDAPPVSGATSAPRTTRRGPGTSPAPAPAVSRPSGGPPLNVLTIDVEDWPQAVINPNLPLTDAFIANTHRLLDALAARDRRATFFVLGLAAQRAPGLVREILAAGHEVQSHGYGHRLIHTQSPAEFRADVDRARKLLEDITGLEIRAYRAPAFSITRATLWALDVLAEAGFQVDSSIFPLRTPRYGIDGVPYFAHRLRTPAGHELLELPVASWRVLGQRIPVGGGGYFRLFPYFLLRRGVQQLNAAGRPATIYVHPHEFSPDPLEVSGRPVPWKLRLHQGLWRRRVPARFDRLLREFPFGSIAQLRHTTCNWPAVAVSTRPA
jgi:polysaccharide deacetylase family protein (PEP-CTERM system associated)